MDGNEEDRTSTVSVFDGPEPLVLIEPNIEAEIASIAEQLTAAVEDGFRPGEVGIFVRSEAQLDRARKAAALAGIPTRSFIDRTEVDSDKALIGIMHLAKGLEFRLVILMACDEGVLPLEERILDVADSFELDEVIATERQLFYVAATRAHDSLIVSGIQPGSEFIDDLRCR